MKVGGSEEGPGGAEVGGGGSAEEDRTAEDEDRTGEGEVGTGEGKREGLTWAEWWRGSWGGAVGDESVVGFPTRVGAPP